MSIKRSSMRKVRDLILVTLGGSVTFTSICLYKNDEKFYRGIVLPVIHRSLDGEQAHDFAIWIAKNKLFPKVKIQTNDAAAAAIRNVDNENSTNSSMQSSLRSSVFGLEFENPVGLAAGFDKNGEAVEGLSNLGFGFVEIGSVTPKPQPGNPRPRLFRLLEDQGLINRYGFNNDGHDAVFSRISSLDSSLRSSKTILGVNLGKNKDSEKDQAIRDYVDGVRKFAGVSDYLVINVSSPNTPGLRSLQGKSQLQGLIKAVIKERDALHKKQQHSKKTPILLKIAPDLTNQDKKDIVDVIMSNECGVEGLIVTNTTVSRPPGLRSAEKEEIGGLSGQPLKELATQTIREMYSLTNGTVPIIGVGGVASGQDALDKISAGASLIQIYSSLVYEGPPVVAKINKELAKLLKENNYTNIEEAVGAEHKRK